MKFIVLVPLLFSLLASCATYRYQPLDQGRVSKDGVAVEADALWAPELRFDVKVTNTSGKTVTVASTELVFVLSLESSRAAAFGVET